MVDTENEIFTVISNVAKTANTKCEVSSVYPSQLGKFPFVLAEQLENYNFTCTAKTPMQDTTTYRLTYRFEAETDGERYYRR